MKSHDPPTSEAIQAALDAVIERHRGNRGGAVADYIPELARADPNRFGAAVCTVSGEVFTAGDADVLATIQSISKPFVYGLALTDNGRDVVEEHVDIEPTGDAFNAIRLEKTGNHRPSNPMVNAGAIATAGLIAGQDDTDRLKRLLAMFGAYMGRDDVHIDEPVFLSERRTGHRNRAIGYLLRHFGVIDAELDLESVLDLYFRQCSVLGSCRDLATMAATLANRGVCPTTGRTALPEEHVEHVLTVMFTCGLYDHGGRFALEVGLAAKSGVSGGVLAVVPGVAGVAVVSPPLDDKGNSVRGVAALRDLSESLGLHSFRVPPPPPPPPAPSFEDNLRADLWTRSDDKNEETLPAELQAVSEAVAEAFEAFADEDGGDVADYIVQLADVDPAKFAIAACTVEGDEMSAGDAGEAFSIQSAANPFTFAAALAGRGRDAILETVGVEPSANPFHSVALDKRNRPYNPMVNAGAIAVASLLPGKDGPSKLNGLLDTMGGFAGDRLSVDMTTFLLEQQAADRNRAIASLLRQFGVVEDERAALQLYLQSCSIMVTAKQLARMGATLANGGINPRTEKEVVDRTVVSDVLTVMYTCGLHDDSGRFAFEVGVPSKSGISGAIVAVAPGRFGLAVWSPPVDDHGNSVRGVLSLHHIASKLRLGLFDPENEPLVDEE